jgi:hypothetical protein
MHTLDRTPAHSHTQRSKVMDHFEMLSFRWEPLPASAAAPAPYHTEASIPQNWAGAAAEWGATGEEARFLECAHNVVRHI